MEGTRCTMRLVREDRLCKRSCVAGSALCYQHRREPAPAEEDRLAVLQVLADVPSKSMFDVRDRILEPPEADARSIAHREWTRRSLTIIGAHLELYEQGLIYEAVPADRVHPGEMKITDAGREVLALERSVTS